MQEEEEKFLTLPPGTDAAHWNKFKAIPHDTGSQEADHFYQCEECGQWVDRRRLGDVLYHEQGEHEALPIE